MLFCTLTFNFLLVFLFALSFSVCIPSVRSSQQFRDTQCCWTGQCHRGAREEQDGEIEIVKKTHKYKQMWHICVHRTILIDARRSTHTFFLVLLTEKWHHGLLVICQDCDSLCQLSSVPTNGHCTLANIPTHTHAHWPTYTYQTKSSRVSPVL